MVLSREEERGHWRPQPAWVNVKGAPTEVILIRLSGDKTAGASFHLLDC